MTLLSQAPLSTFRTAAMVIRCLAALPALFGLALVPCPAPAETWVVGPGQSIQTALDSSAAGDTVLVLAGTYGETLTLPTRRVLLSASGADATMLDGSYSGPVLQARGTQEGTILLGFTVQNGRAENGAGLYAEAAALRVEDCVFRWNKTESDGYGGGIYATECPTNMIVRHCLLYENDATIGGGICCNGSDHSTIVGNTIVANTATHAAGIISYNGSYIMIERNVITGNTGASGYGIYIHSSSGAWIGCNDVWDNEPGNYHGEDMTGVLGNISADPLYCGPEIHDYSLLGNSPCLPGNHPYGYDCGSIGAFGAGCGPTAIAVRTWGAMKGMFR